MRTGVIASTTHHLRSASGKSPIHPNVDRVPILQLVLGQWPAMMLTECEASRVLVLANERSQIQTQQYSQLSEDPTNPLKLKHQSGRARPIHCMTCHRALSAELHDEIKAEN